VSEEQQEANKQLHEVIGENVLTYASVDSHLIAFISGFSGIGFMAGFLVERTTALAGKLDAAERLMSYKIKTAPPNSPKDALGIDENLGRVDKSDSPIAIPMNEYVRRLL